MPHPDGPIRGGHLSLGHVEADAEQGLGRTVVQAQVARTVTTGLSIATRRRLGDLGNPRHPGPQNAVMAYRFRSLPRTTIAVRLRMRTTTRRRKVVV